MGRLFASDAVPEGPQKNRTFFKAAGAPANTYRM